MVVDSSVVMVENCVRHLAHGERGKTKLEIIRDAAVEVRGPTLFGELIIMIVYLPILTLEGVEGKLFRPMALTVIFALAGSMVLSLTLMPVLASLLLPRRISEREPLLMRLARVAYAPLLRFTLHHKLPVLLLAVLVLVVAFGVIAPQLGSEFVPQLSEGSVAIAITRLSGTSLEEAVERNTRIERALLEEFPDEIKHVWSRAGTAEVATDPMGVEQTDMYIVLKPRGQWTKKDEKGKRVTTQAELMDEIREFLHDFPGHRTGITQPIKMRIDEMVAGTKGDLVVKLYGDDLEKLKKKADEIQDVLNTVPGARDVGFEQVVGQAVLQVKLKPDQLARNGVTAKAVLDLVQAVGGMPAGEVVQGMYRFPVSVRLHERFRRDPGEIKKLLVATPQGEQLPLERLAHVSVVEDRPATITREWGQRCINVTANVKDRDLGSFVTEAKQKIAAKVKLPAGRYRIEYGGQFEHKESAERRLWVVVPVALLLIFLLLYLTYGNFVDALRVCTGIPFAAVGGIFALWLRGMPFSISAAIGFIAMSGVAVLDDMILVSTIRQLREKGLPLEEAVTQAAVTRLRPVLMTTLVASLGFLPMAFSTGMGAEVQRPLATVVIGGVISAMVMSLLVVRVLYVVFQVPAKLKREAAKEMA
jgi:cobalt-zinc-cadmium resistance protein CzcA